MDPNNHNNQQPQMDRADFLIRAHIYQREASNARHRVEELNRQMTALQATCHNLIAQIQDLNRLPPAPAAGTETTVTTATTSSTQQLAAAQAAPGLTSNLNTPEPAREAALRTEIEEHRSRLEGHQDQLMRLITQRNAAQEAAERYNEQYNTVLSQMAPPPAGAWARHRRNGNGGSGPGGAGAGINGSAAVSGGAYVNGGR